MLCGRVRNRSKRVAKERLASAGGIEVARTVAMERIVSYRDVVAARAVVKERLRSAGGVEYLVDKRFDSGDR